VLRRVVQANELAGRDWLRWLRPHEGQAARTERAAKKLAGRLRVEPIKKTNLIAVSYDSPDPQVALHVVQSLTGIYLEKHMEVSRPTGQLRFFNLQTQEARRQLEEAKGKLIDFTDRHGVVMAGQQRDLVLHRLTTQRRVTGRLRWRCRRRRSSPRTGSAVSEIARTNRDAGSHRRQSGTIADVEV